MVNVQKGKHRLARAISCCVALLNYLGAYAFVRSFEAEVTKKDRSDRYDGPT